MSDFPVPRPRVSSWPRRLVAVLATVLGVVLFASGTAAAHNALDGSTPADGAVLDVAPTEIVWEFASAVPLDTLTVTLIEADGSRSELGGSSHGGATTQVVTPLPALSGAVTVRWRLVGPDGHPVTGRVAFTVAAPAASSTTAAGPVEATTTTTTPGVVSATATVDPPPPGSPSGDGDLYSTPDSLRWVLRAISYLAIIGAAGLVLTHTVILREPGWPPFRRLLRPILATVVITALLQLLVIASDIAGRPWLDAFGGVDAAVGTDAGVALVVRCVLAIGAWLVFDAAPVRTADMRSAMLNLFSLGLLATWAFGGHARSMRWPAVGIPLDVLHHGAAAAWVGGLVVIGLVVLPHLAADRVGPVMARFATTARTAVIVLVATGLVQAVRLVGNPVNLVDGPHGLLLVLKIAALAGMLAFADRNRRRVTEMARSVGAAADIRVGQLRRAMLIEFGVGLVIIGLTAALVVSTPGVGQP